MRKIAAIPYFAGMALLLFMFSCAYVRDARDLPQDDTRPEGRQLLAEAQKTIDEFKADAATRQDQITRLIAENQYLREKLSEIEIEYDIQIDIPVEVEVSEEEDKK